MEFAKRTAANKAIDYLIKDPQGHMETMMATIDKIVPDALFPSQRRAFANAIEEKSNWYQLLCRMDDLDKDVLGPMLKTFLTEANLLAWDQQEKSRER